jgi:hypothetical protein
MHYRTVQSHGEHDYDLILAKGNQAILEVTEMTSPVWRAMSSELARGRTVPRVLCQKDWRVAPEFGAHIPHIRRYVDVYLAAIEKEGIERFFISEAALRVPAVHQIRQDLRIAAGGVVSSVRPGISLAFPVRGGLISDNVVVNAARDAAWKDDNRRKLGAGVNGERHLFVWVDRGAGAPWVSMTERLPETPIVLPEEVTHLWLATTLAGGNEYLVWRTEGRAWDSARFPVDE